MDKKIITGSLNISQSKHTDKWEGQILNKIYDLRTVTR